MGLLDEIRAEAQASHKRVSAVSLALEQLDGKDRADLEAALAADDITHSAIARVLRKRGFTAVNESKVGHYRKVMRERVG